jgi:hypothetical protein
VKVYAKHKEAGAEVFASVVAYLKAHRIHVDPFRRAVDTRAAPAEEHRRTGARAERVTQPTEELN